MTEETFAPGPDDQAAEEFRRAYVPEPELETEDAPEGEDTVEPAPFVEPHARTLKRLAEEAE